MQYLKPIQMFLSGKYNRSVAMMRLSPTRTVIHWLGRALVYSICHVLPFFLFPAWKAVLFAVVPVGIVSLCFMLSSQVNHLSMENIDVRSTDFYKHQVGGGGRKEGRGQIKTPTDLISPPPLSRSSRRTPLRTRTT